jgi:hypothetical protein
MSGHRIGVAILLAGALLGSAAMAAEEASGTTAGTGGDAGAAAATEQASWRHTKQTFTFFGFTSLYTCDGIEDKTRFILLLFGARKDAKVHATGCERGPSAPSHSAWVTVEFDALAPGPAPSGAETVTGQWTPIEFAAHRPFEMEEGDCELMDHMRYVLLQGFAFKNLDYKATCVPHTQTLGSWGVKGLVLRPPAASAGR